MPFLHSWRRSWYLPVKACSLHAVTWLTNLCEGNSVQISWAIQMLWNGWSLTPTSSGGFILATEKIVKQNKVKLRLDLFSCHVLLGQPLASSPQFPFYSLQFIFPQSHFHGLSAPSPQCSILDFWRPPLTCCSSTKGTHTLSGNLSIAGAQVTTVLCLKAQAAFSVQPIFT